MKYELLEKQDFPSSIDLGELSLNAPELSDAEQLYDLLDRNRDYISKHINLPYKINDADDAEQYIRRTFYLFTAGIRVKYFIKLEGKLIGTMEVCDLSWIHGSAEFGFWIDQEYSGRGYVSRALEALENILFDFGFERLIIKTSTNNKCSQKFAIRNGYDHEGTLRRNYFLAHSQSFEDSMVFSKLKGANDC